MQQPPRPSIGIPPHATTDAPRHGDPESILSLDVVRMLRVMSSLAAVRNDPRTWRYKLLDELMELLPASAACAFILKNVVAESAPVVVSLFDAGFKPGANRQAFLQEFNTAPFRDPFSRRVLDRFIANRLETLTLTRADVIDDRSWYADAALQPLRRAAGVDDCLLSLHRGTDRGNAYALCAFRPLAPPGLHDMDEGTPAHRFSMRERSILDALHSGLDRMYRSEESTHRLNRATELPPRLRQTLECLLAGHTERQVALKLSLSVHTVHDYVKALYTHFGVSSRSELLSKWMQTSGQLPPRTEEPVR